MSSPANRPLPTAGLFFLLLVLNAAPSYSQTDGSQANGPKLRPITMHYATVGGLQYSLGEEPLFTYRQFEDLIYPLRDFESERLLKRSEASDLNAKIFGGVGVAAFLTGAIGLLVVPSNQQTPFWATAIGGAVLIDIGGLFGSEAQTAKFNSVQRYNRFARGEEQVLPKGPADEGSLLNFGAGDARTAPATAPDKK